MFNLHSVQFSRSVMSNSLWPHEPQHARPPCPSPTPGVDNSQTHVHWVSDAIQPSHPLSSPLLLLSIFPSIRVFTNESTLCIKWPKYWSFTVWLKIKFEKHNELNTENRSVVARVGDEGWAKWVNVVKWYNLSVQNK